MLSQKRIKHLIMRFEKCESYKHYVVNHLLINEALPAKKVFANFVCSVLQDTGPDAHLCVVVRLVCSLLESFLIFFRYFLVL